MVFPCQPSNAPAPPSQRLILVCQHRSCQRQGSALVLEAMRQQAPAGCLVAENGCTGQCSSGPTVRVMPDDLWYCRVKVSDVPEIMAEHIDQNRPVQRLLHPRFHPPAMP